MWLVAILGVAARFLTKYIITKGMLVLGLGFVTYSGVELIVDELEAAILTNYNGLPSDMWNIASLAGLDVSITIILSALALSLQIRGIVAGAKMLSVVGR